MADVQQKGGSLESNEKSANPLAYKSQDLLKGRKEIRIIHRDEVYRLRYTSRGKLIFAEVANGTDLQLRSAGRQDAARELQALVALGAD